ncbi:MAG: OB-fold domain-containing protein [Burkholderiales bacterium]|nr:OB-fold domain-containing protein [Burkholderiales bacterium]
MTIQDWTQNTEGLAYQACPACSAVWYFRRTFCPCCGDGAPQQRQAGGRGTVHALTLITRAPSEELRAFAPYVIALVDTDEGFRVMAHAEQDLRIGERVQCRFARIADRLVPRFEKTTS